MNTTRERQYGGFLQDLNSTDIHRTHRICEPTEDRRPALSEVPAQRRPSVRHESSEAFFDDRRDKSWGVHG